MSIEQLIHELILARARILHLESRHRSLAWDNLPGDDRDALMSRARLSVEPRLMREAVTP